MEAEQLALDTTSMDISTTYVKQGTGKAAKITKEGRDVDTMSVSGVPSEFTLEELLNVFEQLGRGDLTPSIRKELAARAAVQIAALRGSSTPTGGSNTQAPYVGNQGDGTTQEGEFYWLVQANFSDDQRQTLAKSGKALPDGSFPIRNTSDLKNAISAFGRAKNKSAAKRHIMKRAKALGQLALVPDNWQTGPATAQELAQEMLHPVLVLDGGQSLKTVILEAPSPQSGGVMKVRVPFYVGGSLSETPTMPDKKLYFGADKLPGIIQDGMAQIRDGKQPITVYARHAHALAGDKLPCGRVVGLEQSGRVGYATMEIAPTADGRDVQTLARNGMLNAVSLRSSAGRYELQPIMVNGEEAFDVTLKLDGIDFAPDGPAQPTYGVEVLAAEARVERISTPKRSETPVDDLTLEAVKARADIVQAIEAPLKEANAKLVQEVAELTKTRDALQAKADEAEREAYIKELAGKFPEPDKALPVIQAEVKDIKGKGDIAAKVMPMLLDVLGKKPVTPEPPKPSNPFLTLFPGTGNGQVGVVQEGEPKIEGETISGLGVPA